MFRNTSLRVNVSLHHHVSVMHNGSFMPQRFRKRKRDVFRIPAGGCPRDARAMVSRAIAVW